MQANFSGLDLAEMRKLATVFDKQANEQNTAVSTVTSGIKVAVWAGPGAVTFRANWTQQHVPNLTSIQTMLHKQADDLRRQAQQ